MIEVTQKDDCRRLWALCRCRTPYGVTDRFRLRENYNEINNLKRSFWVDSIANPKTILPLSKEKETDKYVWFGSNILEDNYAYREKGVEVKFSGLVELGNINEKDKDTIWFKNKDNTISGTKIISDINVEYADFAGSRHWSARNLSRGKRYLESTSVRWNWSKMNRELLNATFHESISYFTKRGKKSKFEEASIKIKYEDIFLGKIEGLQAYNIDLVSDNVLAARISFLFADNVVTVANVVPNLEHANKRVRDYAFRYSISHLPGIIKNELPECKTLDYQGGHNSWKNEVNLLLQLNQFKLTSHE